jgi:tetratricopeptide (TPR) repeat protein
LLALPVAALGACGVEREDEVEGTRAREDASLMPAVASSIADSGVSASPAAGTPAASDVGITPSANVTYGDAERVFRTGDYKAAAAMFEAYAARVPTNPWGPYMLGISAWRGGDHARAVAALAKAVEIDPKHLKGLLNLGRVLLEQGRASDALDPVVKVVELDPEIGEAWRVLGNVRAELRMTEEAMEAYRRAILADHRDAWTMNNLGLLLINEGKYGDALGPLARATELRPDVATFQNNLGVALERSGHVAQAAEAFRAALVADTGYVKARVSLERVEALTPTAQATGLVLSEVASTFAAEVERWRSERVPALAEPKPVDRPAPVPAPLPDTTSAPF